MGIDGGLVALIVREMAALRRIDPLRFQAACWKIRLLARRSRKNHLR